MIFSRRESGQKAEHIAQQHLRKQGLKPVTENFYCRMGEIDLIMTDQDTLVFIEVRMRNNPRFGSAAETVNRQKQQKIIRASQYFLQQQSQYHHYPMRYDIVTLENGKLDWIKNAFQLDL